MKIHTGGVNSRSPDMSCKQWKSLETMKWIIPYGSGYQAPMRTWQPSHSGERQRISAGRLELHLQPHSLRIWWYGRRTQKKFKKKNPMSVTTDFRSAVKLQPALIRETDKNGLSPKTECGCPSGRGWMKKKTTTKRTKTDGHAHRQVSSLMDVPRMEELTERRRRDAWGRFPSTVPMCATIARRIALWWGLVISG